MSTIVLRSVKNAPLTNTEVDTNFTNLNNDKTQLGGTYSSGTANGVLFLSSSKVLTTGSALTFDGSTLATNTASSAIANLFSSNAGGGEVGIGNGTYKVLIGANFSSGTTYFGSAGNHPVLFLQNYSEQMRLTSTGLGIGTSSPAARLEVNVPGTTGTSSALRLSRGDGYGTTEFKQYYTSISNYGLTIGNTGSDYLTLNLASGNLGLGVTPSAWDSQSKAMQFGGGSVWSYQTSQINLMQNSYYDGAAIRYVNTAPATFYRQESGVHQWYTAPSGTAGNAISFTQAMTLDASGNLGVGASSPGSYGKFVVQCNGASQSAVNFVDTNTSGRVWLSGPGTGTGSGLDFGFYDSTGAQIISLYTAGSSGKWTWYTNGSERARIDSSGNLLVGTTTSDGYRFKAEGQYALMSKMTGDATTSYSAFWHTATTGDNQIIYFSTETSATTRGSITYNRAGGLLMYNQTSDYRAKDIIGPVTDSGALIDSVPVYMGKMHGATQERPMFIAHEVPAYAHTGEKDAVDAEGNPVYQQMDASALIPVMWAEIQSLRARLAAANI